MIMVRVPASSANLGSGSDCLGLALPLYFTATFEFSGQLETMTGDGRQIVPEENLLYIAARRVFEMAGQPAPILRIVESSQVPRARGMGSSACVIVAGMLGANALLDDRFSIQELITAAASIEGHPDNIVPCMVGGFTVSMTTPTGVYYTRTPVGEALSFIVAVPDFQLSTVTARGILPQEVPLGTATGQLQRACFLVSALTAGDYSNLTAATEDAFFTPARRPLIPGFDAVRQGALEQGALAAMISGAGPTMLAIASGGADYEAIAAAMRAGFQSAGIESVTHILHADNAGAQVSLNMNL